MARRPKQELLRFDKTDPWSAEKIRESWESRAKVDGDVKLAERIDDYVNRLTGVGDYLQDKTLGGSRYGLEFMVKFLCSAECEDRWRGSDMGGRIVETIPAEMTREGWEISVQPSNDDPDDEAETKGELPDDVKGDAFPNQGAADPSQPPGMPFPEKPEPPMPEIDDEGTEMAEAIANKLEELGCEEAILDALQYERAFGGAAILIGADDGQELDLPLKEDRIASVEYLNVFQGGLDGEIVAWSYYRDPKSKKYGQPETYMIRNIGIPIGPGPIGRMGAAPGVKPVEPIMWVHETRLLVFPGRAPSRRARVQMRGWGDSVFTRIDEVLSHYSQTWGGLAALMSDFKQDVLLVDGVAEKTSADKSKALVKRARTIAQTKSVLRMLVLDKNKEEFVRAMASVQGVSDVLAQFWLRVAAAADMPLSLLTGQVKGGLGDAGNTDIRFFYDRIAAMQRRVLVPQLRRLIHLLMLSSDGPTEGVEPDRWTVKCRPLYRLDALQEAQRRLAVAQTDHIYYQDGVLNAPEIAASAFGGSEYSAERTLDLKGREEMKKQEEADRAERMKQAQARLAAGPQEPTPKPGTPPAAPPPASPAPTPAVPPPARSKVDDFDIMARALEAARKGGAVIDTEKFLALFPELPIKHVIEEP